MSDVNIKKIQIGSESRSIEDAVSDATKYLKLNSKGNLELSNAGVSTADSKVNIVSKSDIQIKPGDKCDIQLDCEQNTTEGDPTVLGIKVSNGAYGKNNRVVATKINTAEVTIDNQKAHTTQVVSEDIFDIDTLNVSFRTDTWKTGSDPKVPQRTNHTGPVDVNLRAKSFDIRCYGDQPGGGIALQPSGRDTNEKENKIKFESSRQCRLDNPETVVYSAEGGKGLEFGTFNNLHSSLYTQDYRFRANAPLYAVVRETPSMPTGSDKFDYPTQIIDDFKDILPTVGEGQQPIPTWADVINVVRYIKTLPAYTDWLSTNKLTVAAVGVDGFDSNNMQHPTSEE